MQVSETFDVQHVNLINKQHTWNKLSYTLVNVLVHNLVDLLPKLVCTSVDNNVYNFNNILNTRTTLQSMK